MQVLLLLLVLVASSEETSSSASAPVKRIIGGNTTYEGQFPWFSLIMRDSKWMCGGSLIMDQWVLTSVSCVGSTNTIYLGVYIINYFPPGRGYVFTNAVAYVHGSYNAATHANDIALYKLPSAVKFNSIVAPIKLPSTLVASKDLTGIKATILGFGRTTELPVTLGGLLTYAQVTIINNTQCAAFHGSNVTGSIICTYEKGFAPCTTDEFGGSLAYMDQNNTWIQVGIISFYPVAQGNCTGGPTGYTRVSSFLDWISTTTGQNASGTTGTSSTTAKSTITTKTTTTTKPTTTRTTTKTSTKTTTKTSTKTTARTTTKSTAKPPTTKEK